jgi:Tfp pilus assembly major pilin PilA
MQHRFLSKRSQGGFSLAGFMFVIVIVALVAVIGMKVVPTAVEFASVKKALTMAKNAGSTPNEIKASFERQRVTAYIESVSAKDLEIIKSDSGYDVSVAYEKKIPLVGPASLVLDYAASTRNSR